MKFRDLPAAFIKIFSLPFAFTGGLWLQSFLGFKFSTAVWVENITLLGVAVEDGIIMMNFLVKYARRRKDDLEEIVRAGLLRVRPIIMTTATTILALFPILMSTGTGSEIMKPIAAPTVGGMVTATLLNLIIVPVIYAWIPRKSGKEAMEIQS